MIVDVARTVTALRERSSVCGERRAVPGRKSEREITARCSAIMILRQHLARMEESVSFSSQAVNSSLEKNELADDCKGEDEVEEDDRRNTPRHPTAAF